MKKIIIIILAVAVVLILLGGIYLLMQNNQQSQSSINQQTNKVGTKETQQVNETQPELIAEVKNYEIIYTDTGYSLKELTIKVGDMVTWKNESTAGLWTASGIHPAHTIYSRTSLDEHCPDAQNTTFDECKSSQPGQSWSFIFEKAGIWRYHNHVQPANFGTIVVK